MEPEKDIFEQWIDEMKSKPWITRKIRYIGLWWENEGRYIPKSTIQGFRNIFYWLPVIWRDRNWDHSFIFKIFSHKLKAQAKYIGSKGIHLNNWQDERDMMICVRLIERVKEQYYGMEHMDYHKTKHWFEPYEDKEGYSTWESKLLEENFDDYFSKYPLIYKRVINGEGVFKRDGREDNKKIIAMNIAHINHERARKLLFRIMEQKIERWWD